MYYIKRMRWLCLILLSNDVPFIVSFLVFSFCSCKFHHITLLVVTMYIMHCSV